MLVHMGQCPEGQNILDKNAQGESLLDYCSGAGDMKGGFLVDCQAKTNNSKRFAHKNDILVSVAGKIGDMCVVDHTISLERAAMSCTAKNIKEITFIYMTLQALNRKMTTVSTGSIQKVINNNHLNDFIFPYQEDIVLYFGNLTESIFTQLKNISQENRKLIQLRDWLLPMLMNGQVSIIDEQFENPKYKISSFKKWVANQGYAARGDVDMEILNDIYEAMDDNDK